MNRQLPASVFSFLAAFAVVVSVSAQSSDDKKKWTAAEDHRNMMDQLGIKALRPGPSGNESAPNHANYDEATANPFIAVKKCASFKSLIGFNHSYA